MFTILLDAPRSHQAGDADLSLIMASVTNQALPYNYHYYQARRSLDRCSGL